VNRLLALGFRLWGGNGARSAKLRLKPLKPKAQSLKPFVALVIAVTTCAPAFAQYAEGPKRAEPVNARPGVLARVGIDQKIGQQLPLDLRFRDETGRDVKLGDFFGPRPVVVALAYYDCPMLCTQVLNGMTGSLKTLSFDAGRDFDVVVVSIDPRDGFHLAADKKVSYVASYGRPATAGGWHFLTGTEASIKPLAEAIGFRYAYDPNIKQYAHGAAIYVATPKGVIARYLLGIDFAPRDLRLALVEASNNRLGSVTDAVLLLCYHYDPSIGKYGVAILNAVRIGFIATVTGFLTFLFISLKRERAQRASHAIGASRRSGERERVQGSSRAKPLD
jgi:protein SCO1/2